MTKAAIALGGNVGDVKSTFKKAITLLEESCFTVIQMSPLLKNPPVGCVEGTSDFINGALTGYWEGTAKELLALCQTIETTLGRPKEHKSNHSRTIDLDIILFGNQIINSRTLKIPHPRAQIRDFVLIPLSQIAPDWVFPDTKLPVMEALEKLKKTRA